MRVASTSMYNNSAFQLDNLTSALSQANEVVSTGLKINQPSDDPVGLSEVLSLQSSISNANQINTNINTGQNWLSTGETALDSVSSAILNTQQLCSQMINASSNATNQESAINQVDGALNQILELANTTVNGSYIFGGTRTTQTPYSFDNASDPTKAVYSGNNTPFAIKNGQSSTVAVGMDGSTVFSDSTVKINSTNDEIQFIEDTGSGTAYAPVLTATVPDGTYTADQLAQAMQNAMNQTSSTSGNGVTYKVSWDSSTNQYSFQTDGSVPGVSVDFLWGTAGDAKVSDINTGGSLTNTDATVDLVNSSAVTTATSSPQGSSPFTLSFDGTSWSITNEDGYNEATVSGTATQANIDLNGDGTSDITVNLSTAAQAGDSVQFDLTPAGSNTTIGSEIGFKTDQSVSPIQSDTAVGSGNITITSGSNDSIDFEETPVGGTTSSQLTATIPAGTYTPAALASTVQTAMDTASANGISYAVSYNNTTGKFSIQENGTQLEKLDILWGSGTHSGASAASAMGFSAADASSSPLSGQTVSWGIFNTLINLKSYLADSDVGGISKCMTDLENEYNNVQSAISDIGVKSDQLQTQQTIMTKLTTSLTTQSSSIENADIIKATTNLNALTVAYQAALASTSKVLGMSLANYIS